MAGWDATVVDYNYIWDNIPLDEKERVGRLEWLDEVEEWKMLNAHYCLVTALKK